MIEFIMENTVLCFLSAVAAVSLLSMATGQLRDDREHFEDMEQWGRIAENMHRDREGEDD